MTSCNLLQGVGRAAAASGLLGAVVAEVLADARPQILCGQRVVQRHGEHGEDHHRFHGHQRQAAQTRPPGRSLRLVRATPAGVGCLRQARPHHVCGSFTSNQFYGKTTTNEHL